MEYSFNTEREMVYDTKVNRYHIVSDYVTKLKLADMKKTYEIIDDNITTDETERSRRQEVLFQASLSRGNKTFQAVDSFDSRVFRLLCRVPPGKHCHSCICLRHFSCEQRRVSGQLSANQNVGHREPKTRAQSKKKKISVTSSRRSATRPSPWRIARISLKAWT